MSEKRSRSTGEARRGGRARSRRMLVWVGILAAVYAAWCLLLYFKQDSMMFPRHLTGPAMSGAPAGVESLWVEGEDGSRVEGWFVPPPVTGRDAPLLVFFHGNGELIDHGLELAALWGERGYAVLLPEYRGYGRSGGRPSERAIVTDALRLVEMAAAGPGVDRSRIVLHGRSLGGAVAAQVAARVPVSAVIVESCFPSAAEFAARLFAPPILVKSPFHTARALARFGGPVLVLHGRDDEIVPVREGRRLHERVAGSVYAELAGGHNDFPAEPEEYWRVIEEFIHP